MPVTIDASLPFRYGNKPAACLDNPVRCKSLKSLKKMENCFYCSHYKCFSHNCTEIEIVFRKFSLTILPKIRFG